MSIPKLQVPYHLQAPDFAQDRTGLWLPSEVQRARKRPLAIDLFAGAGGFSLGIMRAGFEVIAALEYDTSCALTYTTNLGAYPMQFVWIEPEDEQRMEAEIKREMKRHEKEARARGDKIVRGLQTGMTRSHDLPGVRYFFLGDIRKISGQQMLSAMGLKPGDIDLVVGGPPCQGFSRAGMQRVMDPRNSLVMDFARMIIEIQPKMMIMENVPDIVHMVTPEGVNVVDAFCRVLADGGFASYNALKSSLMGHRESKGAVSRSAQSEVRDSTGRVVKPGPAATRMEGATPPPGSEVEQLSLFEGTAA